MEEEHNFFTYNEGLVRVEEEHNFFTYNEGLVRVEEEHNFFTCNEGLVRVEEEHNFFTCNEGLVRVEEKQISRYNNQIIYSSQHATTALLVGSGTFLFSKPLQPLFRHYAAL